MNVYRAVGEVTQSWIFALHGIRSARVREPFVLLGGLQLILLLALGFFHSPALVGLMEPVVRFLGGETAVHYPELFWVLPELYRSSNTLLAILFGWMAWAVAMTRFAGEPGTWSRGLRRAPSISSLAVLGAGSAWLITSLFNFIPVEITMTSFVIRMGLQGIELGLIVVIMALYVSALPYIILADRGVSFALGASIQLFKKSPLTILLLYAVPAAILFPPSFFLFEMNMDEAGLAPEAVGLLMIIRIALRIALDVLVVGGITRLYLNQKGQD